MDVKFSSFLFPVVKIFSIFVLKAKCSFNLQNLNSTGKICIFARFISAEMQGAVINRKDDFSTKTAIFDANCRMNNLLSLISQRYIQRF
jgi:hypothetical protein